MRKKGDRERKEDSYKTVGRGERKDIYLIDDKRFLPRRTKFFSSSSFLRRSLNKKDCCNREKFNLRTMEREDEWVGSFLFQFVRPADPSIPRIRSFKLSRLSDRVARTKLILIRPPFFLSKDVAHASQCSLDKSQRNINRVSMLLFLSTFSILSGPFDVFALRPPFVAMRDSPYEEITRMNHVYTDPEREEKGWKVNTEQRSRRTFQKKAANQFLQYL